jgi:ribose/xylose/arabinose/galactoside ABC-type transport system permease subunit
VETAGSVASADQPSLATRLLQVIPRAGVYLALAVACCLAALLSPAFYRPENLLNILRQSSALGILSVGQTIVMLGGGLDISVAATMQLATIAAAEITKGENTLVVPAVLVCLALGILVGLINGTIIAKRHIPPFVATLGVELLITGGRMVYTQATPSGTLPPLLRVLGQSRIGPIPVAALVFLGIAALAAIVLQRTTFGRQLYATGGNRAAARLSGINVDRITILTYVLSGFLAAVAGLVLAGYVGYADQWMGKGMELDSMAAAVVGGTTFAGGQGGIVGTVAGVLLVSVLLNLVLLLNLDVQYQLVLKGLVIIAAVAIYSVQRRD